MLKLVKSRLAEFHPAKSTRRCSGTVAIWSTPENNSLPLSFDRVFHVRKMLASRREDHGLEELLGGHLGADQSQIPSAIQLGV
jgi:hypothetical protein